MEGFWAFNWWTLAGALTSMIISECSRRGVSIDGTEAASLTVILTFLAGYYMPSDDGGNGNAPNDVVVPGAGGVQPNAAPGPNEPGANPGGHN
jgi:hypothetical protein